MTNTDMWGQHHHSLKDMTFNRKHSRINYQEFVTLFYDYLLNIYNQAVEFTKGEICIDMDFSAFLYETYMEWE